MDELIAFLNARLAEDERTAEAAARFGGGGFSGRPQWINQYGMVVDAGDSDWAIVDLSGTAVSGEPVYVHIARHDPARALREVEAKRAILTRWEFARNQVAVGAVNEGAGYGSADPGWPLRADSHELDARSLAAVYSDHGDYRQEWKP